MKLSTIHFRPDVSIWPIWLRKQICFALDTSINSHQCQEPGGLHVVWMKIENINLVFLPCI